jgi:protein-S-isoprenylcysteine O-methyltransferase Ste14
MASRLLAWAITCIVMLGLLFVPAGRLDLPMFWAFAGALAVLSLIHTLTVDPGLARERMRPGPGGTDRSFPRLASILFITELLIAGLDAGRFHWSDTVPLTVQAVALVISTACFAVLFWASTVNRFFSPVVRIQSERGHHVVADGPYRYARHPGYAATILGVPGTALALGSAWALVPAAVFVLAVLRRMLIEDRYLKENLPGYREYAGKVRSRIVPGLW